MPFFIVNYKAIIEAKDFIDAMYKSYEIDITKLDGRISKIEDEFLVKLFEKYREKGLLNNEQQI